MFTKILSGGQTGAERAALDAAISLDVACGGWITRGRWDGNACLPSEYNLQEISASEPMESAVKNITASDGTMIISSGPLSARLEEIHKTAHRQNKPFHPIDVKLTPAFRAAAAALDWINQYNIQTLYVTGAGETEEPLIYGHTRKILETMYYLGIVKNTVPGVSGANGTDAALPAGSRFPETIGAAADLIINEMPLRDRVLLSNFTHVELGGLQPTLGLYIRKKLASWSINKKLMNALGSASTLPELDEHGAAGIIIEKIWQKLRQTHRLRVVK